MAETMTAQQRLVLVIAIIASFIAFLDGTVVNVALPAIRDEFGGGIATQQWVVDAYYITLAALILLAGSVSDAFGRILILRVGLIGFGITSIVIALSPDAIVLFGARALQGASGALLVPSSLALITSAMRGALQGRAIGIWTAWTTVAFIIGPILGGLFVDLVSWRWVFVINIVPIGVTLWLTTRLEQHDVRRPDARIDWLGAVLCTLGLGGTVYALIEQPQLGWTPVIWITLIGGILLFGAFLWRQAVTTAPILPLGLFRVRNFWTGNVATVFIYAGIYLVDLVIIIYLQQQADFSATFAGVGILPWIIMLTVLSPFAGTWAGRYGPRLFMTLGPVVMAIGTAMLLLVSADFNYWWQVLPALTVFGTGLGLTVSPLTATILGAIEPERAGIASATNNAISRVGGLLGIALLATITGGALDLDGLHRAAIVMAALLLVGGIVAFLGIRNPAREPVAEES
ncbi:MFS transporter [Microbacterium thalassium]|uniref:EmrB/QacA subfamily drug resistance transporter n=1 Tax=Microbacterium thalassium TaxID=362649 RepID=A0A7X0KT94_9MICO|nr:MFS transporter [Microbacterium thalassium]MBB6389869.1 EmrB/QacA subfamily drug resistance transporter [Microbacterium thalassium]GLK24556.1 MFS transporter [Microbacterium thalassium]